MSRPNSGVGRVEHLGMPRTSDADRETTVPPLEEGQSSHSTAGPLDVIMAAIRKLEARMDETDRRAGSTRPPSVPDPDPPYGMPGYKPPTITLPTDTATVSGVPHPYGFSCNRQTPHDPHTDRSNNCRPHVIPNYPHVPISSTRILSSNRPLIRLPSTVSSTHRAGTTLIRGGTLICRSINHTLFFLLKTHAGTYLITIHCSTQICMFFSKEDNLLVGILRPSDHRPDTNILNTHLVSKWIRRDLSARTRLIGYLAFNITSTMCGCLMPTDSIML